MDFEIGGVEDTFHWKVTFFYGFPNETDRYKFQKLLEMLHVYSTLPWCIVGDFYEVLQMEGQQGGDLRSERQMAGFQNALQKCQLFC